MAGATVAGKPEARGATAPRPRTARARPDIARSGGLYSSVRMIRTSVGARLGLGIALLVGCDAGPPAIPPLPDSGPTMDAGFDGGSAMAMCDNATRDGDETGVDCGGSGPPCDNGDNCRVPDDCVSMVCGRGRCLVPTCLDGVRNGDETGADCGGDCGLCPGGEPCTSNDQCLSGRCRGGTCAMSTCEDGRMNGDETDVDCGGPLCRACEGGANCDMDTDCESLICAAGLCTDAACNDRVQNQDETSVDCGGGICPPCRDGLACIIDADCEGLRCFDGGCVSCVDMIRDAEETDVDCGGGLCPACDDGLACLSGSDCESGTCISGICESCIDGVMNQDETDVDCGGTACRGCADGLGCLGDADCSALGATCAAAVCVSCADGAVNRDETDVDCGGAICPRCAPGRRCTMASDCASMICDGPTGLCNAPGCGDMLQNGEETDLDCGGSMCIGCATGLMCVAGRDCLSGVCTAGTCRAPTCSDGVANGDETDVDCGGATTCPRCVDGRLCPNGPSDCISPLCTAGRCGMNRGHLVLIGHDYFAREPTADRVLGNAVLYAAETGTIDVLVYDQYADISGSGEVANAEAAIRANVGGRTINFTRLRDSTMLSSALTPAIDVLLLPEQESGSAITLSAVGTAWRTDLMAFLAAGGVIISTNFVDPGTNIVNSSGLATITGMTGVSFSTCTVAPGMASHPLAAGVVPYPAPNGSGGYLGLPASGGEIVIVSGASTVVYHRLF